MGALIPEKRGCPPAIPGERTTRTTPGGRSFSKQSARATKPFPGTPRIQTTNRDGLQTPDKQKALTPTRDGSRCPVRLKPAAFIQRPQSEALVLKQPTGLQTRSVTRCQNPPQRQTRSRNPPSAMQTASKSATGEANPKVESANPAKSLRVCRTANWDLFLFPLRYHAVRRRADHGGQFRADKRHPQKPRCHLLTGTMFQARAEGGGVGRRWPRDTGGFWRPVGRRTEPTRTG